MPTVPITSPFRTAAARAHRRRVERRVDGVVAAAVLDDHREPVRAELADAHHRAWRDRCTGVPIGAAMPMPFQRIVVLFGLITRPKR